jgi:hypothetical protein
VMVSPWGPVPLVGAVTTFAPSTDWMAPANWPAHPGHTAPSSMSV